MIWNYYSWHQIYKLNQWIFLCDDKDRNAIFNCKTKKWDLTRKLVPVGAVISVTINGNLLVAGGGETRKYFHLYQFPGVSVDDSSPPQL